MSEYVSLLRAPYQLQQFFGVELDETMITVGEMEMLRPISRFVLIVRTAVT
jgi:hypothetical protein